MPPPAGGSYDTSADSNTRFLRITCASGRDHAAGRLKRLRRLKSGHRSGGAEEHDVCGPNYRGALISSARWSTQTKPEEPGGNPGRAA